MSIGPGRAGVDQALDDMSGRPALRQVRPEPIVEVLGRETDHFSVQVLSAGEVAVDVWPRDPGPLRDDSGAGVGADLVDDPQGSLRDLEPSPEAHRIVARRAAPHRGVHPSPYLDHGASLGRAPTPPMAGIERARWNTLYPVRLS